MLKYTAEECSEGLLSTDVALIAVNETHAVFSIRIARAALAENHSFLNVISDLAGGDVRLAPPDPKSKPLSAAAWGWPRWLSRRKPGEEKHL